MSLRHQINIRILFFSVIILIAGGSIAVWQARTAISEEVDASINMALQLIEFGFAESSASGPDISQWLHRLGTLKQTRHLTMRLRKASGDIVDITGTKPRSAELELPPAWFVGLVLSEYPKAEYRIQAAGGESAALLIQADPLDEIIEVWQETIAFFVSIALLTVLTFLAVHLVFDKTLKSIDLIVKGLHLIETGDYRHKLPAFSAREYDSIASAINHMTDVLYATQQENRSLTQHSLKIREEERKRLAQELHDELGQSLTAIKVMAVTAANKGADTEKITTSIVGICDHLMSVVRSMMHQLHPLILSELGLKAALEDMVQHWTERHPNLHFTLECDDGIDALDQAVGIQLFRVIQECLTNAVRHAHAEHVDIRLNGPGRTAGSLHLAVCDDGRGCDIGRVSSGFGLRGMAERIESLGGELTLSSRPGRGMTVRAAVPMI
ncbi:MAG: ATP-binding protein [Gammaproteobacteria bacterium]